MRLDKIIHSARIRGKHRAIGRGQRLVLLFRHAPHAQTPRLAIQFERRRSDNLGQISSSQTPDRIHLPEAILRGHKSLQEDGVFPTARRNVRDAQRIAHDSRALGNRSRDPPRDLGQWTVGDPIHGNQARNEQNSYAQVDVFQNFAGMHSYGF